MQVLNKASSEEVREYTDEDLVKKYADEYLRTYKLSRFISFYVKVDNVDEVNGNSLVDWLDSSFERFLSFVNKIRNRAVSSSEKSKLERLWNYAVEISKEDKRFSSPAEVLLFAMAQNIVGKGWGLFSINNINDLDKKGKKGIEKNINAHWNAVLKRLEDAYRVKKDEFLGWVVSEAKKGNLSMRELRAVMLKEDVLKYALPSFYLRVKRSKLYKDVYNKYYEEIYKQVDDKYNNYKNDENAKNDSKYEESDLSKEETAKVDATSKPQVESESVSFTLRYISTGFIKDGKFYGYVLVYQEETRKWLILQYVCCENGTPSMNISKEGEGDLLDAINEMSSSIDVNEDVKEPTSGQIKKLITITREWLKGGDLGKIDVGGGRDSESKHNDVVEEVSELNEENKERVEFNLISFGRRLLKWSKKGDERAKFWASLIKRKYENNVKKNYEIESKAYVFWNKYLLFLDAVIEGDVEKAEKYLVEAEKIYNTLSQEEKKMVDEQFKEIIFDVFDHIDKANYDVLAIRDKELYEKPFSYFPPNFRELMVAYYIVSKFYKDDDSFKDFKEWLRKNIVNYLNEGKEEQVSEGWQEVSYVPISLKTLKDLEKFDKLIEKELGQLKKELKKEKDSFDEELLPFVLKNTLDKVVEIDVEDRGEKGLLYKLSEGKWVDEDSVVLTKFYLQLFSLIDLKLTKEFFKDLEDLDNSEEFYNISPLYYVKDGKIYELSKYELAEIFYEEGNETLSSKILSSVLSKKDLEKMKEELIKKGFNKEDVNRWYKSIIKRKAIKPPSYVVRAFSSLGLKIGKDFYKNPDKYKKMFEEKLDEKFGEVNLNSLLKAASKLIDKPAVRKAYYVVLKYIEENLLGLREDIDLYTSMNKLYEMIIKGKA